MTTTILIFAIGLLVGVGLTRLWDFLWDALDRRDTRDAIRGVGGHPEAQPSIPEAVPAPDPLRELIRTEQCPIGFSAKQVLGYGDMRKRRVAPQFPGGLEAWDRMHEEVSR